MSERRSCIPTTETMESGQILGNSRQIRLLKECVDRVAATEATVLISGETGTGKDLFARRLHEASRRRNQPLVSVNCAAIPDTLLESELFGYEKGAFTGAASQQDGTFLRAAGGTVLLDGIGDLSASAQAKLLRVLEDKQIRPLGSGTIKLIDVRLVASTNCDLEQLVAGNKFRQDLFFRLNVIRVHIPPLRERKEDIPLIADHFLAILGQKYNRPAPALTAGAQRCLMQHPWVGNARELRNVIERAFFFAAPECITESEIEHLCHVATSWRVGAADGGSTTFRAGPKDPGRINHTSSNHRNLKHNGSERELLRQTLNQTKWNKSKAAKLLQCSRMTIYRKVIRYQLNPPAVERGSNAWPPSETFGSGHLTTNHEC